LREKYEEWIRQLDERIAGTGSAPTEMEIVKSALADSPTMEQGPSPASGVDPAVELTGPTGKSLNEAGLSRPKSSKVVVAVRVPRNASLPSPREVRLRGEAKTGFQKTAGHQSRIEYRQTLISENKLLREMLERFG
jgi:hypothetical protein